MDLLIRLSFYCHDLAIGLRYTFNSTFNYNGFEVENLEIIFNHMMPVLLSIFISFLFYAYLQGKKNEEKEALLAKTEKNFLVSQINPHFLFNTLNNIYSLSLDNNTKGPEAIMQLSKMLDYSLYRANKENVILNKEIQYLTHFINLFKLKDDKIDNVTFDYSRANKTLNIAPMLLIPFVENAFKHGNIEDVNNGFINIILKTENNKTVFNCENSYVLKKSVEESSGIGIANVKRRLELLYPNKHKMQIENKNNCYKVYVIIS